jgi:hypothetical protein
MDRRSPSPATPGESEGTPTLTPSLVVNFWSTSCGKQAQTAANGMRTFAAWLRETTTADKPSQRFSPKSHPGGRRFESG